MKSLVKDNQGVVVGLVAMIVITIMIAMLWIVTMPAVGLVWDIIAPKLDAHASGAMNMLNNVCGWFLIIMVIGTLIYGAAWATHRDPVDVAY